ncbi:uncharacterized protein BXZ73DRAFT_25208, partial [Epithele typhae]|uniref:uncharacterized protein n=1 Tax=Epithele typhae TaxID=378194 RepID=UPI002008AEE8
LQKVEDLWYEDGTIILIAGTAAFCVHKGVLIALSPIFRDILALPQSPNNDTMEGRVVVRIADSGPDMTNFLRAVFCPGYKRLVRNTQQVSFPELASILRMAHKYEVPEAVAIAVDRLSQRFCAPFHTSLGRRVTWDDVQKHLGTTHAAVNFNPADAAFEALNLMRRINAAAGPTRFPDRALAVALFYCCVAAEQNPRLLRSGAPRKDGTVETPSDADFERCVRGI